MSTGLEINPAGLEPRVGARKARDKIRTVIPKQKNFWT